MKVSKKVFNPSFLSFQKSGQKKIKKYAAAILSEFDSEFYLLAYPDNAGAKIDPLGHYLIHGWRERADPCRDFSVKYYLETHKDVAESGIEPFYHWITQGHKEGRKTRSSLTHIRSMISPYFDKNHYIAVHKDVSKANIDALDHYMHHGIVENRLSSTKMMDRCLYAEGLDHSQDEWSILSGDNKLRNFSNLNVVHRVSGDLDAHLYIGIVTWKNSQEQLERLLNSIRIQNYTHVTIGILDNSPNYPEAFNILEKYDFCKIDYFAHPDNLGFSLGHNALMDNAFSTGSDYYLGLNPDGFLLPNAIENALNFISDEIGILDLLTAPLSHPKNYELETGYTSWSSGVAFLLSKKIHHLTKGFDPKFPMYGEDVDLSMRIRKLGFKCATAINSLFFHDICERFYETNNERQKSSLFGNWYLMKKWGLSERTKSLEFELGKLGQLNLEFDPKLIENDVPNDILTDLEKERYAYSRFF